LKVIAATSTTPAFDQFTNTQIGLNLLGSNGVELAYPGQTPPVPPSVPGGPGMPINRIGNFDITQVTIPGTNCIPTPCKYVADKPGKDNNVRGLTIYDNTLYVSKGSGGNGINTVYQVGDTGVLPMGSESILTSPPISRLALIRPLVKSQPQFHFPSACFSQMPTRFMSQMRATVVHRTPLRLPPASIS
jgi:hypothetical protein